MKDLEDKAQKIKLKNDELIEKAEKAEKEEEEKNELARKCADMKAKHAKLEENFKKSVVAALVSEQAAALDQKDRVTEAAKAEAEKLKTEVAASNEEVAELKANNAEKNGAELT